MVKRVREFIRAQRGISQHIRKALAYKRKAEKNFFDYTNRAYTFTLLKCSY